jgi:hypothetical protein
MLVCIVETTGWRQNSRNNRVIAAMAEKIQLQAVIEAWQWLNEA